MNIIEEQKENIKGILHGFDRIVFNGFIRQLCNTRQMLYYLIQNDVKLVDFHKFANEQTNKLCSHIDNIVKEENRPMIYVSKSGVNKEDVINSLKGNPIKKGLVCAISTLEVCKTMTVKGNKESKKLEVMWKPTKCKYYYLYFLDEMFGWMYFKIQTWFPYNAQVYINGREYLCKQLDNEGIKYERFNNSLTSINNIERAEEILDHLFNMNIERKLDYFSQKFNPLLTNIKEKLDHEYFWTVFECEFATDIMFKDRETVENIFPSLVETAFTTFKCDDIMSFFGRKLDYKFQGEIVSDLRKRYQGFRIKHKMKSNQVKMYDKYSIIRIETTINDPHEFKVWKYKFNDDTGEKIENSGHWILMGKSVSNLYRYAEVAKATNTRYINALPATKDIVTPVKEIETISSIIIVNERRISGFNFLSSADSKILEIIASGDFIVNGITNKTLRCRLFRNQNFNSKQVSSKTSRLLNKLKHHGIIKKVNHSSKYYLTTKGRKIINSILLFKKIDLPNNFA